MKILLPFIAVAVGYLVLFVIAGGTFRASAAFLRKYLPTLRACTSDEVLARALMIFFAANLLGAVLQYQSKEEDTAAKGYLMRGKYGEGSDTAELELTVGGMQHDVDVEIRAREMSPEELTGVLTEAEKRLPQIVLGKIPADHVDGDLTLPEKIEGLPVTVSWMTDRPDILDWDGHIAGNVPDSGTPVVLTAEIVCEDEIRECELALTVFPCEKSEEEAFLAEVLKTIADANDATEGQVSLPGEINGEEVSWATRGANTGMLLLLLGFMTAVMFVYSRVRLKEIDEEKRCEQMKIDYPDIVNKLVLLVSAGMSLRRAFVKIRDDYRRSVAAGGRVKPGYEEIVKMSLEMEHGVPEIRAYENLGKRCRAREFKTFATLLSQSVTRGGSELGEILRQEAFEAVEERKKRARVLGEEAGTKLLLPMLLMLVIVMAILMVPAFVTFM